MITISTNKGLVKIDQWEDVRARAGFSDNLNPDEHPLDTILGKYVFGDQVRCGLSNCHTLHTRGYLVATKTGRETNIGKDCGKNYFGVDFIEAAKQFEADYAAHQNRELLWSFHFATDELEEKIANLRAGATGADWVNKHTQALIDPRKMPLPVTRQIDELIKRKASTYTREREATAQEIEDIEARTGKSIDARDKPVYVTDYAVSIDGIEAMYPENNLRELLAVQIIDKLKVFKLLQIDTLTNAQLLTWKKWATAVEQILERAEEAVEHGRRLLVYRNLSPLLNLQGLEKDNGFEKVERFLGQLTNG